MRDELLTYYERELTFVRAHGRRVRATSTPRSPAVCCSSAASARTRTSSA